ncbi:ddb1 and cul4 associated factor 7 [Terramyces sp. JEL0728]|nr:ddb1 and cul4 associated factor 7 [Terramyces sp. JEL0728]
METAIVIKWTVFTITVALLVTAIYLIPQILYKNLVAPIFRPKILLILVITIGHTSLNVYNLPSGYVNYVCRFADALAQICVFMITLFNIHILQVFSLLNPNITRRKLLVWLVIVSILFICTFTSTLWHICVLDVSNIPAFVAEYNVISSAAFTVFAVLYDNIQGAYLIYLVLINKKKKGAEIQKVLNGLVISLVVLSLMDWFGVIIFAIAEFIPSVRGNFDLYSALLVFADTYTGIHGTVMIYVFKQLTEFTFVDSKCRPQKKEAPSSKKATAKISKTEKSASTRNKQELMAPLTSFDWSEADPNQCVTSSLDTTCTIWDMNTLQAKTQLIAHDSEVLDVAFSQGVNVFGSVGADGSVRMFDQRVPAVPVLELQGHKNSVSGICWAPHSSVHLGSCGDDGQTLIWDISKNVPIKQHVTDKPVSNLSWNSNDPSLIGITAGTDVQVLHV